MSQTSWYSDKISPGMKGGLQKLNIGDSEAILEKY